MDEIIARQTTLCKLLLGSEHSLEPSDLEQIALMFEECTDKLREIKNNQTKSNKIRELPRGGGG